MKAVAVLVLALSATAQAQSTPFAARVLARIDQYYASVNTFTASFRQTVENATFGTTKTSDGRVALQVPANVRFDYLALTNGQVQTAKTFVSDGTTTIMIDHLAGTYYVPAQVAVPGAVQFFFGATAFAQAYTATVDTSGTYGSPDDIVVELSKPDAHVFLIVDRKDWHVRESVMVDSGGNVNRFRFYMPNTTKAVPAAHFSTSPPAGYTRIP